MSIDDLVQAMDNIQKQADSVDKTSRAVGNASNSVQKVVNAFIPDETSGKKVSVKVVPAGQGQEIISNEQVTPVDTCIFIDQRVSSTGVHRYLGSNVYRTIQSMMAGQETVAHAVVVDSTGRPSANVYDRTGAGYCLKGTNIPVTIKEENGKIQGVLLSEKEYAACVNSIKTTDQSIRKFSYDDRLGSADDANSASWFQRNWDWLLSSVGGLLVGIVSFLLYRNAKKKTKTANNITQNLKQEVSSLTEQVADLTEKNNALANSSQLVGSQTTDNSGSFMSVAGNSRD